MSDIRTVGGQNYILENGAYRKASEGEAAVMSGGFRSVAIKSALADVYSLGNLALGAISSIPVRRNIGGRPLNERFFEAARAPGQFQQDVRAARPEAAETGEALIDVAGFLAGAGLARGGSRAANVQRRLQAAANPDGVADEVAGAAFGASTAGAAQAGEVKGLGKLFRFVTDKLENPRSLSADEFEILDSRMWDDVGFQFPPGSLNSKGLYASYLSNPFTKAAIEPDLIANAAELGTRFISAVGLNPAKFPRGMGRGVVSASKRRFRSIFNNIADTVDGADLSGLSDDLAPYMTRETKALLKDLAGEVDGRTLFSIRSRIRKAQDRAWKNPDEAQIQLLDNMAEELDDIINENLPDSMQKLWGDTREQYRTFKVLERPGVIDPGTGDLSLKSLALRLGDQYNEFSDLSPAELSRATFRNKDTGELLKFARVARTFADSISDSGTATRSTLQTLAANPKAAAKMVALRYALESGARGPDEVLDLMR